MNTANEYLIDAPLFGEEQSESHFQSYSSLQNEYPQQHPFDKAFAEIFQSELENPLFEATELLSEINMNASIIQQFFTNKPKVNSGSVSYISHDYNHLKELQAKQAEGSQGIKQTLKNTLQNWSLKMQMGGNAEPVRELTLEYSPANRSIAAVIITDGQIEQLLRAQLQELKNNLAKHDLELEDVKIKSFLDDSSENSSQSQEQEDNTEE